MLGPGQHVNEKDRVLKFYSASFGIISCSSVNKLCLGGNATSQLNKLITLLTCPPTSPALVSATSCCLCIVHDSVFSHCDSCHAVSMTTWRLQHKWCMNRPECPLTLSFVASSCRAQQAFSHRSRCARRVHL